MRPILALLLLSGALALASCGKSDEGGDDRPEVVQTPEQALAGLPAPYNTGDLVNGKSKAAMCRSCHTFTKDGPNGVGPNLHNIFGRQAGKGAKDYKYSDVVKNAGFAWDADHLDKWLTRPKDFLPGTKMTFQGLPEAKDRVDLIAYIRVESGYKPPQ
ncbi:cytochrome c family protein [soil metagenome]